MDRPLKTDAAKYSQRLIVRLTDDDKTRICANAQKAGLSISEYVRRVAVKGHTVTVQQSGYGPALAHQVHRSGVNLNQLAKIANATGELPPELASACEKIDKILDRILRTS